MRVLGARLNKKEDLDFINELFESGHVRPVIDRCYSLSEASEAFRDLGEGKALGKVVVTMGAAPFAS